MRRKIVLLVLTLFAAAWLSACSLGPVGQPQALPPEQATFDARLRLEAIVAATLQAIENETRAAEARATASPTPTPSPTSTSTPTFTPSATAAPSSTPTPTPEPTPTALPEAVRLSGFRHQIETRNNCGPATLAMALSYWGWQGDQTVPQSVLRPNSRVDDKNVSPDELVRYVAAYTQYRAFSRVGGDLELLKRLIAAGFPVMVEKGHITSGWIGHYILLSGYDDSRQRFLAQDSLSASPDQPVTYSYLQDTWWRHFNYQYIIIFPPEREAELVSLLGSQADPMENWAHAAGIALKEIDRQTGRELFFAWHNLGSSLAGLENYEAAAQAFDTAFQQVYPTMPVGDRPWRTLWYQHAAYRAYYQAGRYDQVIEHADQLLKTASVLEESYYWRGKAHEALGDLPMAAADYRMAYELNPGSTPAVEELHRLGLD
jgi:tetratricopeptide (TPR) repeat protein